MGGAEDVGDPHQFNCHEVHFYILTQHFSSLSGRCWLVLFFLLATALCASGQAPNGNTHGFISFALPRLVVDEGASNSTGRVVISVPLVREVGSTGAVIVAVTVSVYSHHCTVFWCVII